MFPLTAPPPCIAGASASRAPIATPGWLCISARVARKPLPRGLGAAADPNLPTWAATRRRKRQLVRMCSSFRSFIGHPVSVICLATPPPPGSTAHAHDAMHVLHMFFLGGTSMPQAGTGAAWTAGCSAPITTDKNNTRATHGIHTNAAFTHLNVRANTKHLVCGAPSHSRSLVLCARLLLCTGRHVISRFITRLTRLPAGACARLAALRVQSHRRHCSLPRRPSSQPHRAPRMAARPCSSTPLAALAQRAKCRGQPAGLEECARAKSARAFRTVGTATRLTGAATAAAAEGHPCLPTLGCPPPPRHAARNLSLAHAQPSFCQTAARVFACFFCVIQHKRHQTEVWGPQMSAVGGCGGGLDD
ncbi:MAG: hypothetical protein J3K34DRAFT_40741 [Monoraphidium minutum]|nr:MAG: hypothetical protein J3K34DRAFT_40741 [Monoraphidium minutum]